MGLNNLNAGQRLVALLHYVGLIKFTADREKIHSFFSEAQDRYQDLLDDLEFIKKDIFPESRLLDQAISNMESGRLLQRMNRQPRYYEITEEVEEAFNKFVKPNMEDFSKDEPRLKELAREFKSNLEYEQ